MPSFNWNAAPFIPSSSFAGPPPSLRESPESLPTIVTVLNLPTDVGPTELKKLIDSIVETSFPEEDCEYEIADFDPESGAQLAIGDIEFCHNLVNTLNGYEWLGSIIDAKVEPRSTGPLERQWTSWPQVSIPPMMYTPYFYPQATPPFVPPPPPPQRFLSRRTSSNKSLEQNSNMSLEQKSDQNSSRKSSRSSVFESKKNSVLLMSSMGLQAEKKPVPPFIVNMIGNHEAETTKDASKDNDFMYINEADEQYKVNPRRLFIGNVPYSSSWLSLKLFLLSRTKALEPDTQLAILRVEIPTHQPDLLLGDFSWNKSRGFAIVTTGDRQTSAKLIELFDNVDFEGRLLTVRYDRYPDFNNYTAQTKLDPVLYTSYPQHMLNYMAFERNQYHQKMYYGDDFMSPYFVQQYGFAPPPNKSVFKRPSAALNITSENVPVAKNAKESTVEEIKFRNGQKIMSEDEKARDLISTFEKLGHPNGSKDDKNLY